MSTREERRFYEFGSFRMDPLRRRLYGPDGEAITLKPKVFDTLHYLVEHAGELLDKSTLLRGIWGDVVVEENSLNQHISILRRTLGEAPGDNRFIVTVQGQGYRFVATVREVSEEPGGADQHEPAAFDAGRVSHTGVERPGTALWRRPVHLALTPVVVALGSGVAYFAYFGGFDAEPDAAPATVSRPLETNEARAYRMVTLGRRYELEARGDLVLDDDKLAQAIDAYRQATVTDPDSVEAWSRLAAALLYRGDVNAAEAPVSRARELDPERSETQYALALYRLRLGLSGIAEAYEKAIAYDPNNADALGAYGQWFWGHRDAAGAQQYLVRALELEKQSPTRWLDYVEYLGGSNQRDALLELVHAIRARFANPQGHLILARLYELTGDLDEGIAWALKAYAARSEDSYAADQLAELYARIGDVDSASFYEPDPGIGQLALQRRYPELIELAEETFYDLESPIELNVWYFLAFAYGVDGYFRDARELLERSGLPQKVLTDSYTPAETQALMTYISALRATDEEPRAREYATLWARNMQRNVDSGMGDAWWPNTHLACVQAELGNVDAALNALDRVRTGSVSFPWSWLLVDSPCFGHLADEPRYQALVAHVEKRRAELRAKLPETLARHGLSPLKTSATQ